MEDIGVNVNIITIVKEESKGSFEFKFHLEERVLDLYEAKGYRHNSTFKAGKDLSDYDFELAKDHLNINRPRKILKD